MARTMPDVPRISWFEMEILFYLLETRRYGNEIRLMLNRHLGIEAVTTGKLYPVLKKLEKTGLIKRLKMKKKDIQEMETGMSNILTRGVERIYFEITEKGIEELQKAVHFASFMLYERNMSELNKRVKKRLGDILDPLSDEPIIGVMHHSNSEGVEMSVELLPDIDDAEFIFLPMSAKRDIEFQFPEEILKQHSSFPSRYDDIPLKTGYLSAAISVVHLSDIHDPSTYLSEVLRTIRPGGYLVIVTLAKLDSSILKEIYDHHAGPGGSVDHIGDDPEAILPFLEGPLVDIEVERLKEYLLIHGRRKKKPRKHGD